jgi:hypothetical protein
MFTEPDAQRIGASRRRFDQGTQRADAFSFLAITPFERPDFSLARTFARHGSAVAVDVGRNSSRHAQILETLRPLCSRSPIGAIGIRIPDHVTIAPQELFGEVGFVVLTASVPLESWLDHFPIIVQVGSEAEARMAIAAGASALIARGEESGGPACGSGAFVLLQRILALPEAHDVPDMRAATSGVSCGRRRLSARLPSAVRGGPAGIESWSTR